LRRGSAELSDGQVKKSMAATALSEGEQMDATKRKEMGDTPSQLGPSSHDERGVVFRGKHVAEPIWKLVSAGLALACVSLELLVLSSAPALASKVHVFNGSFGTAGVGNGEFVEPSGVAVDDSTEPLVQPAAGDVYIADKGNNRVEVFNSDGAYLSQFNGSATPAKAFSSPSWIAVDNSTNSLDPSVGDVYVADTGHGVVDKFSPTGAYLGQISTGEGGAPLAQIYGIAVDPEGVVWVYQQSGKIDSYSDASTNTFLSARTDPYSPAPGFAVDAEGSLYTNYAGSEGNYFLKLNAAAEYISTPCGREGASAAGVDFSTDDVYVDNLTSVGVCDADGSAVERFGAGHLAASSGIAVNPSIQTVYVADSTADRIARFTEVVQPDVSTGPVSAQDATSATVSGTVNPEGQADTTCEFEYGPTTAYGQTAPCASEPGTGEQPVEVTAKLANLQFGETYHYRLVAANGAAGSAVYGEDQAFVHGATVAEESATEVTSSSARLQAQIDANGAYTTYYFQYGTANCVTTPSTCTDAPAPAPGEGIGADVGEQSVGALLQNIHPGTVYYYRAVAVNVLGIVEGPYRTFTTQTPSAGLVLPDGRAWELVSPVENGGAQVLPSQEGLIQASEAGDAISYYLSAPFTKDAPGNAVATQAISRRSATGWITEDIATPHNGPASYYRQEYRFFSPNLSQALVEPLGETPLAPEVTEATPYVRDNATGTYTPLVTPANVPPGTKFSDFGNPAEQTIKLVAASPSLSHVVLQSKVPLTSEEVNEDHGSLYYEWVGGQLHLINALPPSESQNQSVIGSKANIRHAVSTDGSRVFWSAEVSGSQNVYMTDVADGEVVRLNTAQGVGEPVNNRAEFQTASADGSSVVFSDPAQLTTSPGGGLYVYDVETGKLRLVTVPVTGKDGFSGLVFGASEDGSYIYVLDKGVLSESQNAQQEKAIEGGDNLYLLHRDAPGAEEEWTPSFITTLSADDEIEWNLPVYGEGYRIGRQTVEVSHNGQYLAFMSDRSLTGYDNRDAVSGEPDEEVYLYDAADARLVCASCNPTGARPSGWLEPEYDSPGAPLSDLTGAWGGRWVAATIPGLTELEQAALAPYEPNYMLDSGRLFFDSRDALVPQDVDGVGDVYEYEPEGVGSCASGDGCVALISGGTGPEESAFVDASVSGNDVFFVTTDRLTPQDVGSGYELYDARVCSAEAPCPSGPVAPPPCSTADGCHGPAAPQPALYGPPPSATFSGAGNLAPIGAKLAVEEVKPSVTRARLLAKALRKCRLKPKQQRVGCERRARHAYGPVVDAKRQPERSHKHSTERRGRR
jgi:hypothetical protein